MNLMELFVKIGVDDQASSKVNNITGKIGGGLKTAADIGVKAITAASTAIVGLTGLAIKNYAEYEQLVGGVETLFKESADIVKGYAADAYKTSGMSANDYMKNATAFSASLISSLGGDTAKAAEYANTAMVSMSDNANKMGTDIESIVATYQSLSRGNMAMLDNLKLGYGGTKAELQRLIKDAASYTDVQKEMGLTVDESSMSFDNIVNAIAVVQGHLGIAGATALEASTTIEGSVLSMRAAWNNLVTGVADDNADFDKLIDDFVKTTNTAAKNLLPRFEKALKGVGKLISKLFPTIMDRIPQIITKTLPEVLTAAGNIAMTLINGIIKNLPLIINTAINIVLKFANGITGALPKLVPAIVGVVLKIVDTITKPSTLSRLLEASLAIIIALANGLIKSLPKLLAMAPKIVANLVASIITAAPKLLTAAAKLIATIVKGIGNAIGSIFTSGKNIANKLIKGINNKISSVINAGKNFATKFADGVGNKTSNAVTKAKTLGSKALNAIRSGVKNVASIGRNLVSGLWQGVSDKIGWVTQKMASFGKRVVNSLKNFFGIHSPSTVMRDEIGRFLAEGVAVGFMENDPMAEIETSLNNGIRKIDTPSLGVYGGGGYSGSEVSIIQNIYSQAQTAADLMQEAIYQQEKAVYLGV